MYWHSYHNKNIKQMEFNSMDENTLTKTLEIHAYDWVVRDSYGDDDHVAIHCWALDKESNPHLVRLNNFPAFCHIELPMFVRNRTYTWRKGQVDNFMNILSQRLGDDAPVRYIFKEARKTKNSDNNLYIKLSNCCSSWSTCASEII